MIVRRFLSLLLISAFLLLPVGAGQALALSNLTVTPTETQTVSDNSTFVEGSNRYGYLTIESVAFSLSGTDAEVTVEYEITPWIAFLVFLFGKQDLKNRVLSVIGYPETGKADQVVTFTYVDNDRAVITVKNAVVDYKDGSYWYPMHEFGTVIPTLTFVVGSEDTKIYNNTQSMPKGFGYFQ
jgi:hypothetical protein